MRMSVKTMGSTGRSAKAAGCRERTFAGRRVAASPGPVFRAVLAIFSSFCPPPGAERAREVRLRRSRRGVPSGLYQGLYGVLLNTGQLNKPASLRWRRL